MTRIAGLVVATATVLLLAGCSAAPEPLVTATPITAQETCSQLGDVMTILHNARVSFAEGRSIRQEYDGAIRLASRVLARVPAEAGSKLGDSVNALKVIAPDRLIGSASTSFDPDSAAWGAARLDVALACTAAGSEIAVEGWTGG